MQKYFTGLLLALICLPIQAELTPEQLEEWFNNDKLDLPEEATVQDEKLRFITSTTRENTPLTEKSYFITPSSLKDGWVVIEQCYRNLDPVPKLEVVYEYQHMRNLQVTQQYNVGKLWIEAQSVQMENLQKGASVCTRAEVKILRQAEQKKYLLLAGPFKRKFLDGYYPMHVKLSIHYPARLIVLDEMYPQPAPGFNVTHTDSLIKIDTHFSGKLYLAMSFTPQASQQK